MNDYCKITIERSGADDLVLYMKTLDVVYKTDKSNPDKIFKRYKSIISLEGTVETSVEKIDELKNILG